MNTLRTVLVVLGALVVTMVSPAASGLVGIYGIIERVAAEGAGAQERLQVWGAFAYANGGVGNASAWSPVKRGYLYFRLPDSTVASAAELATIRREWSDLRSVAGTGQVVAFGRWGYIGRFDALLRDGRPMFLERAPHGGEYTDLRVRAVGAALDAPAAYHTNAGVVRIPADGSHAELVTQLRAAIPAAFTLQTGPAVAAMPGPAGPVQKKTKDVAFAVRSVGCDDLAAFTVTASAVARGAAGRAAAVKVTALPSGAFAIGGPEGTSVVSVSANCGSQKAGATVRLTNGAYSRDAVELLPHHPTQADVDRALSLQAGGGRQ
jgi:hypothetical protein